MCIEERYVATECYGRRKLYSQLRKFRREGCPRSCSRRIARPRSTAQRQALQPQHAAMPCLSAAAVGDGKATAAGSATSQGGIRSLDDSFFWGFLLNGLYASWPVFFFAIFSGLARGTLRVAEGMNRVIPAWGPETWELMHAASSSSKAPARQNKIVVSKMPVFGVAKVACKSWNLLGMSAKCRL